MEKVGERMNGSRSTESKGEWRYISGRLKIDVGRIVPLINNEIEGRCS